MTQEEILQTGRLAGDVLDPVLARQAQHRRHLLRRHLKAQAATILDDVEPQGLHRLPDGAELSARSAQLCHCEFCIDITSMTLAARSGSQDKLLAVADWRSSTLFSEKERLALAYAEAATQTPPAVDDALRSAMAAHFDARALTELTALIGLQNLSARFNAAMAIPAQGLCQIPTSSSQNKE